MCALLVNIEYNHHHHHHHHLVAYRLIYPVRFLHRLIMIEGMHCKELEGSSRIATYLEIICHRIEYGWIHLKFVCLICHRWMDGFIRFLV
jgi:hypothetical protein